MATGLRALKLAFLGRLAAARGVDLGPLLPEIVARHMAELSRPEKLSQGNHGLFQMSGLKALAWQFPDVPGAAAAAAHALAHGTRLLDRQLGPQGVHTEDAPDYHFFAVALIGRLLAAPGWQVSEMAPFRARLAAARNAEPWLMDPVGRCLPVGDSTEARRPRDTQVEVWLDPTRGHLPLRARLSQPEGGAPLELQLDTTPSTGP